MEQSCARSGLPESVRLVTAKDTAVGITRRHPIRIVDYQTKPLGLRNVLDRAYAIALSPIRFIKRY